MPHAVVAAAALVAGALAIVAPVSGADIPSRAPEAAARSAERAGTAGVDEAPATTTSSTARVDGAPATAAPSAARVAEAPTATLDRVEEPIRADAATGIASSYVRLRVPLPADTPPHPEACDWIAYERFRALDGPDDPMRADAVTVLMPGLSEGATAFDQLARNAIRESARRGRTTEVWALDRRANCLEDLTGLQVVERTGDEEAALGYYYRGEPIDGRRFAGWNRDDAFLAEIGVRRTVEDVQAILTRELPDQRWREQHVLCGGHSLGGPLTTLFASWDFDGDPTTSADAGWRQCAGFVGFDTLLDVDPRFSNARQLALLDALSFGTLRNLGSASAEALRRGLVLRHLEIPGITPRSLALVETLATRAANDPDGEATANVDRIPRTVDVERYFHLTASTDLARWFLSNDSVRDHRYTNAALFGQLLDDNGAPYGLVRSSIGFFDGAPLRRNVLPNQAGVIPGLGLLLQRGNLAVPARGRDGDLTGWRSYDELGQGASQVGAGYTSPAKEVTDLHELARSMYEGPTNLAEAYFPTRIVTDVAAASLGNRSGDLAGLQWDQPARRKPRFAVMAGDGVFLPNGFTSPDPHVVLPGYDHLDVLTAAERQNDGRPEGSSQALANFVDAAVPPR